MPTSGKAKILVIEDNDSIFDFEQKWLSLKGYHFLGGRTGQEGLDLFAEHPDITLIILDLVLPDISGRVVMQKIRKKNPTVPIIICSAYREKFSELSSLDNTHTLFKPFLPTALQEMVEAICE